MKRSLTTRLLTIIAFLILFTVAAKAQCDTDAETDLYNKFLAGHKGTPEQQKAAGETARQYIAKYGDCPTEEEKKITTFIRSWLVKHDAAVIEASCTNAVEKTPAKAFELCQPYLAKDPDNLRAHLLLALAGVKSSQSGDTKLISDTVKATRKALDLIAVGKTVSNWIIADNRQEAVGVLEYFSGYLTVDSAPAEAAAALLRVAKSGTGYSKNPSTYYALGRALYESEARKLIREHKEKCEGKAATPECDALYTKLETSIDRVIDAFARAVALGKDKPEYTRVVEAVKPTLTTLYKQRHGDSEAGLNQFVTEVLAKPIP